MGVINYQKELDTVLENIEKAGLVPSLLLHSCCGPCSSYCLKYLRKYFNITLFYYNPNIYPEDEYDHRLSEQLRLIEELNKENERHIEVMHLPYDHQEYLDFVKGHESAKEGGERCEKCFGLRLKKSYDIAAEKGFDYYATTLTVSPHKNALLINAIGREITECGPVKPLWLPSDFKKKEGYKQSIELSKKYDLYRQNYCGCEFSIWF